MKKTRLYMAILALALNTVRADFIAGPEEYILSTFALFVIVGIPIGLIAVLAYLIIRHIRKKHANK